MQASWHALVLRAALAGSCLLPAACSDAPAGQGGVIVAPEANIVAEAPVAAPIAATSPAPTPAPERPRPITSEPPLPPELLDDGKLKPLPPRPPAPAIDKELPH